MEISEVLKGLGIDLGDKKLEDLKIEDIKTLHSTKFVGLEVAHDNKVIRDKVIGSVKGGLETKIKRGFKDLGIEFDSSDNLLDTMIDGDENGFKKIKSNIEQIREDAKGGNDEKLNKLQGKFDTLTSDFAGIKTVKSQLEKDLKEKDKDLKNAENTFETKKITDNAFDSNLISNDFIADTEIRDTAIEGFNTKFAKKYKWELDPSDESPDGLKTTHIQGDSKGSRVLLENKFASLQDIYKSELKASKMLKLGTKDQRKSFEVDIKDEDGKHVPLKSAGFAEKLQEAIDNPVS